MQESYTILPLAGPFGKQILDIDIDRLDDDDIRGLLKCLYENRFLVLRTGGVTKRQYVDFARRLGSPITLSKSEFPEIVVMNNEGVDSTKTRKGAAHWHSDQSYQKHRASITMLYCAKASMSGGETRFCDLAGAYAHLPDELKTRIDGLDVIHRHGVSIAARPGDHTPIPPPKWDSEYEVQHPLVIRHPVTGVKTLYAISGTSQGIVGMSPQDAAALLEQLCDIAFAAPFVSGHAHSVNDITLWDNPTTLHSATPMPAATGDADTREVHRISLIGESELAASVSQILKETQMPHDLGR